MRVFCLSAVLLFAMDNCGDNSCTEMGCQDELALEIRTEDNTWLDGQYEFEFNFDDKIYKCEMSIPYELQQASNNFREITCEPDLYMRLEAETLCTEERDKSGVAEICQPIFDQWYLNIIYSDTPRVFRIQVTLDQTSILDQSKNPTYREYWPNGKECGPVCEQSQLEIVLD
jgi:hypothetical protein